MPATFPKHTVLKLPIRKLDFLIGFLMDLKVQGESRPAELPRQPLAEQCLNLSIHTAPIKQMLQSFQSSSVQTNAVPFLL
jgi:hypothetical protein